MSIPIDTRIGVLGHWIIEHYPSPRSSREKQVAVDMAKMSLSKLQALSDTGILVTRERHRPVFHPDRQDWRAY